MKRILINILVTLFPFALFGQIMSFEDYNPPSTLVVPENPLTRAKFPFIDVHNHQFRMGSMDLNEVTTEMDNLNMAVMVNLSGRGFRRTQNEDGTFSFGLNESDYLKQAVENAKKQKPGRFIVFTNIDFNGIDEPDWAKNTTRQLEIDVRNGANGLKIYKSHGLSNKDKNGKLISVDDPRIDPVWAKCGELGIPVLIHTGEPAAFWLPKDKNNERWLELKQRPGRYRDPAIYPSWEQIMGEQHNVFRKHPNTIFIMAHLGWMGNDLGRLG